MSRWIQRGWGLIYPPPPPSEVYFRITPASPPPASPPFRQDRRCEKSVPVDPRSAVPLPDTNPPPPPLTEAWPELGGQRRDLASTSVHMLQVQAGQPAPKRRKKYDNIDSRLHQLGLDYMICQRTMESYMKGWPYDGQ